jgi:hypothetical protein
MPLLAGKWRDAELWWRGRQSRLCATVSPPIVCINSSVQYSGLATGLLKPITEGPRRELNYVLKLDSRMLRC